MRFRGLLVVRDEADIIAQSIQYALSWADVIYAYDTGSTDGTWEILQEIARANSRLVLYGRESLCFSNDLRAVLFERYRREATEGDWFVTVDADEFYHIPPPVFVEEHLRFGETAVCYQLYDFKLTTLECSQLRTSDDIARERRKPIEERRRYYLPIAYAEPRLFRYRRTMQWIPKKGAFNLGFVARERIPIRHYPNRDPLQMEVRYRLRYQMRPHVGYSASPHWVKDWHEMLVDVLDTSNGLKYWAPGSRLERYNRTNHLAHPLKRVAQRIIHPLLLPVLDRLRPRYPADYAPDRMQE